MPISTVAAGAGGLGSDDLHKRIAAGRVPETNSVGVEVDLVGNVVPHTGVPVDAPLGLATDAPPQQGVGDARGTGLPAGLELGKVALEEGDLVLAGGGGGVGVLAHKGEVVKDLALVDGGRGLGDQLGTAHVLAVPVGRVVEGDLGALVGATVGRVLVAGREVDVGGDLGRPVDVVLVGADLVAPRPLVQVGRGGEVVEAAIPENGASRDGQSLGQEASKNRELHRGGGDGGDGGLVVVEDKILGMRHGGNPIDLIHLGFPVYPHPLSPLFGIDGGSIYSSGLPFPVPGSVLWRAMAGATVPRLEAQSLMRSLDAGHVVLRQVVSKSSHRNGGPFGT